MIDPLKQYMSENDFEERDYSEEKIGVKGINSGTLSAGVGYLIIPIGTDPQIYKEDAILSGRISMYGGLGHGDFHQVPVDRGVLQRLKFPKKIGEHGSAVVWVKIPKHESPVVVATLKHDDDVFPLKENQKRTTKTASDGSFVDVNYDPERGRYSVVVYTNDDSVTPEIVFKVGTRGESDKGRIVFQSNNELVLQSDNRIVAISQDKVEVAVRHIEDLKNKARVVMCSRPDTDDKIYDRLLYEDEYNNIVKINSERVQIKADDSSRIVFGEDDDNVEPLVKGDTLVDKIGELIDAINQITVPTAFGPSGTPINAASFTQIKNDLSSILSELTNTQ